MWMCLMSLSYFLIARADEVFATSSGKVHPAHTASRVRMLRCFGGTIGWNT